MYFFYPIAYPIAKLLDYVLGQDAGHTYKKAELKSFLQFHREGEEPLRDDEVSGQDRSKASTYKLTHVDCHSQWCTLTQRKTRQVNHDTYCRLSDPPLGQNLEPRSYRPHPLVWFLPDTDP